MSTDDFSARAQRPNKSQQKREIQALKALGERIIALPPATRARLPLSIDMLTALDELSRINAREARRRHLQYVGKVMRDEDLDAIHEVFASIDREQRQRDLGFHRLERWRDRLIDEDDATVAEFVNAHPAVDPQMLRQLIRNARRERDAGKPPASARKLFRLIREASEL